MQYTKRKFISAIMIVLASVALVGTRANAAKTESGMVPQSSFLTHIEIPVIELVGTPYFAIFGEEATPASLEVIVPSATRGAVVSKVSSYCESLPAQPSKVATAAVPKGR